MPLIANGSFLGPDQPIILHLLDVEFCKDKLEGVRMEIEDCAFPLLKGIVATTNVEEAFSKIDFAFLVGAFPRRDGMERKDLLAKNASIFQEQGKALSDFANPNVRVVVVGNPANTNALICQRCAPNIPKENFTAMTRLDHNRAIALLGNKCNVESSKVKNMIIWGNHSSTQYPDSRFAEIEGSGKVTSQLQSDYLQGEFITTVQKRGAAIIKARGLSSALSAAFAAVSHMRDWVLGTKDGEWVSMGIPSDGSYGIPEGVIYSYPVSIKDGKYTIVQDLPIDDFSRDLMTKTHKELLEEKKEAFDFLKLE